MRPTTNPDVYVHRTIHWLKVAAAPVRAVGRLARRVARRQPLLTRAGLVAAVGSVLAAGDVIDLSRLQPAWRTPVAVAVAAIAAVGWVWPAVTPVKDPRPGRPATLPELPELPEMPDLPKLPLFADLEQRTGAQVIETTGLPDGFVPPPATLTPPPADPGEAAGGAVTQEIPVVAGPPGTPGPCADPE